MSHTQAVPLPIEQDTLALPPLRQDLRLLAGGAEGESVGRWKIHDPIGQRFFEVEQRVVDILALWREGTAQALIRRWHREHGDALVMADVQAVLEFLNRHELLHPVPGESYRRAWTRRCQGRQSCWQWLLHSYLFVRVPLVRPAMALRKALPLVAPLFHPVFWGVTMLVAVLGLFLVSRQWQAFITTLPEMFSVGGIVAFSVSLALIKTLHELGHGFMATRLGTNVTSMGVALIVMMPVLYTDTTDAWRLTSQRHRVLIDLAGVAVELTVAAYATLAWVFLSEGPLRYVAFALATTGWVLSLAVNLNPLMRFDGYYLFSDLLGIANLQERAFAMGRWWLREFLFGYGDPRPEDCRRARRVLLIGFALAVWLYRFFLFLGIALLVYHYFFKVLGVFLFCVEILVFLVMPIWRELRVWWQKRQAAGRRAWLTLTALVLVTTILVVPLPHQIRIPAVLAASQRYPGYSPRPARIEEVMVKVGDRVAVGSPLVRLAAPELNQQQRTAAQRLSLVDRRIDRRSADRQDLSESLVLASEKGMQQQTLDGLARKQEQLAVRSAIDGVVADVGENLHRGRWVNASTRLVLVVGDDGLSARGYLDSEELRRVHPGQVGVFIDDGFLRPPVPVAMTDIAGAASGVLDNWMLASAHGGKVASRIEQDSARPETAVFEVDARVMDAVDVAHQGRVRTPSPTRRTATGPMTELRGEIHLHGEPMSLAVRAFTRIIQVLVREWGA
ncbi:HlyD family efflux transporter periplasmic adaptor subunit [Halomonas sp. V046]|uniref:HlyD family efflux transporter periplasmic adaptor subunit n=1 Tax=Halomonas sp. V046 TaxID=3459611 RepID=UPI0040442F25